MRISVFLITAVIHGLCKGQEVCEIFPRNPVVLYGSDVTLFLRAQSSSECRSKTPFRPSRIFWTLDERKIDDRFYSFNSTFASVSILNVSVERCKVKCFLNDTPPVLLHDTFILTYPVLSSPTNVSCFGKKFVHQLGPQLTCMWDHEQYITDVNYTVHFRQDKDYYFCPSKEKNCTFKDVSVLFDKPLSIAVSAQNSYGYLVHSNEVTYSSVWNIVKMDPPDVNVEPLPTGLRLTWRLEQRSWSKTAECEIRLREKDLHTEIIVKHINSDQIGTKELTSVTPCTNYTVSMRSKDLGCSVWSSWSRDVPVLSYLNVSSLKFHFWRSKSVLGDRGKRTVLLMWKGVPPSCKAIDEYCVSCDSLSFHKCFGPYENNMFITLDKHPHRITVAAFHNKTSLNKASIEVPAMEQELDLPPVKNISVFVQHGGIHITWEKPSLPVNGYLIVWNSTAHNHMWQQTPESNFTLKGEPLTLYTISLSPLYKDGPGNQIVLHNCNQDRNLSEVSDVQVIRVSDKHAEIHWVPILPIQCCAFVLNYTVFYRVSNKPKTRNVTVGPNQHHVILEDLQAQTEYSVYVMARTAAASSESRKTIFSTKPSKFILIGLITCSVGLVLFSLLAVTVQRKCLSKKIPDPRFSSLSMWPSDNCRKPWNLFSVADSRDTEKILPCHVDSDVICVSRTSKKDIATLKALANIKNIITHEIKSQPEPTPLAAGLSKGQTPNVGKEQKVYPVQSVDLQPSGICPLSPVQSLYRQQTPLSSPIESPSKTLWSDETETLLTPKLKNTAYFTSYVTLDMFEPIKQPSK
ncbi:granulocyte colony-stimulating factor receptor-like isoform X1 [Silurus meridionalis]|uniref:Fibronectin type-III domain-containing protein n=2 Tax=Silurus meridionalis TaxID=175797 RepID=A0A8T0B5I4_SILME|nr:granulocyte colony-stimulating factor receptor-like isoform X1 [Silurus meridionalis]KAF7701322.1 hypothetical protein HF521_002487 [Silurus meridionalis]